MVGTDDYQCVSVLLCKTDSRLNSLVEIKDLFHYFRIVVSVSTLVDACTFHHKEESFSVLFVGIKEFDCILGRSRKEITSSFAY